MTTRRERSALPRAGEVTLKPPGPVTLTRGAPRRDLAAKAACGSPAGTRVATAVRARNGGSGGRDAEGPEVAALVEQGRRLGSAEVVAEAALEEREVGAGGDAGGRDDRLPLRSGNPGTRSFTAPSRFAPRVEMNPVWLPS